MGESLKPIVISVIEVSFLRSGLLRERLVVFLCDLFNILFVIKFVEIKMEIG